MMLECYPRYRLKKLKSRLPFAHKDSERAQMARQIIEIEKRMDEAQQGQRRCSLECEICLPPAAAPTAWAPK